MAENRYAPLSPRYFRRDPESLARGLLGRYLVRQRRGRRLVLRIVETEAYLGEGDRASHAWRGRPTRRTATLFRSGGCAYVYLIYGIHCMFNVVAGRVGEGGAALVHAGAPPEGTATMRRLRRLTRSAADEAIASGPGKLCQALEIDRSFDGADVTSSRVRIARGKPVGAAEIVVGARVGVDYAGSASEWPLRFAIAGSLHVSRPAIDSTGRR